MLPAKFAARGLDVESLHVGEVMARRDMFENDWDRRLNYLVKDASEITFDAAWKTFIEVLGQIKENLGLMEV